MRNLRVIVAYDGTNYYGFQTQPGGNTVQDKLEAAIAKLTGETVKITASGRTDAGVHARGQVFNFYTESSIPVERWCLALNSRLPKDIITLHVDEVPLEFHSRRMAIRKTYCYTIRTGRFPDIFQQHIQLHHIRRLDVEAMRAGLEHLLGEHDFTTFCSTRSTKESHVRTIYKAWLEVEDEPDAQLIRLFITGNGFLYNMVRIIVGTLLQVGTGKRSSDEMGRILAAQDRSLAGPLAEAHGLILWSVEYPDET